MQNKIKVASVQAMPVFMDKKRTIDKYCTYIVQAGKEEAKLVVTPETGIPTYPYWRGTFGYLDPKDSKDWRETILAFYDQSVRIPSPETDALCKAAKSADMYCVIGLNEQDDRPGSKTLYNTLLFISRNGEILGRHRKTVPTYHERTIWGRGDSRDLQVFKTDIGRIGGLICYENHMTLLKSTMASMGEEIHACSWPGYWTFDTEHHVRDLSGSIGSLQMCDQDCCVREYAFETQTFVISSSLYLPPDQVPETFPFKKSSNFNWAIGGSCIAGPFGNYLVEPVFNKETIIYAELDMNDRIIAKHVFDCMGHYNRWDLVSLNISKDAWEPAKPTDNKSFYVTLSSEKVKEIGKKYRLDRKNVESLLRDLDLLPLIVN